MYTAIFSSWVYGVLDQRAACATPAVHVHSHLSSWVHGMLDQCAMCVMCLPAFSLSIQILWCVYRYDCSQRSHNIMCSCVVCGVEFVLQWDHALTNNHSVVASMLLLHAKNWDPQNTQVQALAGSLMQHQLIIHVVSYHFICPLAHHPKKVTFLFFFVTFPFIFFFLGWELPS